MNKFKVVALQIRKPEISPFLKIGQMRIKSMDLSKIK